MVLGGIWWYLVVLGGIGWYWVWRVRGLGERLGGGGGLAIQSHIYVWYVCIYVCMYVYIKASKGDLNGSDGRARIPYKKNLLI